MKPLQTSTRSKLFVLATIGILILAVSCRQNPSIMSLASLDIETSAHVGVNPYDDNYYTRILLTKDGTRVYTIVGNFVHIYSTTDGSLLQSFQVSNKAAGDTSFIDLRDISDDGSRVAIVDSVGKCKVFALSGQLLFSVDASLSGSQWLSPDGNTLLCSTGDDGLVHIRQYDVISHSVTSDSSWTFDSMDMGFGDRHVWDFISNNSFLVLQTTMSDSTIQIRNSTDYSVTRACDSSNGRVYSISRDSKTLCTQRFTQPELRFISLETGQPLASLNLGSNSEWWLSAAILSNSTECVIQKRCRESEPDDAEIVSISTGQVVKKLPGPYRKALMDICCSSNSKIIAACYEDAGLLKIVIWHN